jgi:hypothetical protein
MSTDPTQLHELEVAKKWLDITISRFIENMRTLRIQDTGALMASFQQQVVGSAEGRLQLRLSYALYGKFVDMGVGRGMGAGVRQGDDGYDRIRRQLRRHTRQPRNWYSRELSYQTKRLSELMLDLYGNVLIATATNVAAQTTLTL